MEEKVKFLKEHGWEQHWSDDNWIPPSLVNRWKSGDYSFDIDRAGCSTERAYRIQLAENNKPIREKEKLVYIEKMKEGNV